MNIEEIKALAEVLKKFELTVLEYAQGDTRIRLERACACPAMPAQSVPGESVVLVRPSAEEKNDFNNMCEVKSPMVGVFYAAPSPEAKPFVKVGDMVEKGQIVCLIEAMKLMNDITAPVSGRIVDICAQDGAVLEYGQTILKIV
ncbi:MAG: acetyl-CoA carboxylase biotin carboxyl carrier protein [Eubacteriales bacterium]|nr:acetyl-CoA carboxylase biotin carboxyl carrier protein [Eubacteriales bacterium]